MRLAVVQMTSGGDVAANVSRACAWIDAAADEGADLVLLPEFFNTIYFAQYQNRAHFALAEPEDGATLTAVRARAAARNVAVVATIYEIAGPGLYYDTAFLVDRTGTVLLRYRKTHPSAVLSLEKLYFRYGTRFPTATLNEWRVGIGICYDLSFPETARALMLNGAELILAPYATSRTDMFQELLRTRAFENGCFLAAANKVGVEGGWTFGGGSLIAGPRGQIMASAGTEGETMLVADIERRSVFDARIAFPSVRDRRPDLYRTITAEVDAP
ncbi:MAG: acyltransferase [Alphaproteobacteria bacterium]|nr:acyltransferase [Alphaproteobacteria bacterium]